MAKLMSEVSRTFNEYLLIPGYTTKKCTPENVSLKTPLVRFKKGEEPELTMNIPMVSAIMQSVSGNRLAVALAAEGGVAFIYGAQPIDSQAEMVRRAKSYKAGFVPSDSNVRPDATLRDVLELKERTGHSTMAVTEDGSREGKLLGIITSRDYRVSRTPMDAKVESFMTPLDKLVTAKDSVSLTAANDIIWEHKLNTLPIVDKKGNLKALVFRKDYETHKDHPNELLDDSKRYIVGAGINSRDYKERVPALVEAGADVLCIDSSEGFSGWQKETLDWIHKKYKGKVRCGAGNVVDAEGFNFLADAGADFIKVGIGGGSICITRETKGIGRGQATALMEVCKARDAYYKKTGIYVPVCSDGGIVYDHHITLALAMGADAIAVASAALIAAACQQYRICGTGYCPVGIATQNPMLRERLKIEEAAKRVANYLVVSNEELKTFARISGLADVHALSPENLITTSEEIAKYTGIAHAGQPQI